MKKSELKTGMVVTFRNGEKGMVFKNICTNYTDKIQNYKDVIVSIRKDGNFTWEPLDSYREEMLSCDDEYDWMDIMKVELVEHPYDIIKAFNEKEIVKTVFEREDENKMFLNWLAKEYAKHFVIAKNKEKSVNELIYTIRMSKKDFCLNIIDGDGSCLCIPSANETFIPSRYLAKKIEHIEYDTEEPEYPVVIVKTN